MPPTTHLLIVDPQHDFCDLPAGSCPPGEAPALPVPGADADLRRLAAFLDVAGGAVDGLTITLDSHQRLDIAHPTFWRRGDGSDVPPFTPISAAALREGAFVPRDPSWAPWARQYVAALEAANRYTLMVWPVHCVEGSWGHGVHGALGEAVARWEVRTGRAAVRVCKGRNPWTEHYSVVQAEVPDPEDPETLPNRALLDRLAEADRVVVAGEAGSHCVRASVEHLAEHVPPARLVLLGDCMSPVAGFAAAQGDFLAGMAARGARVTTSVALAAEMAAELAAEGARPPGSAAP
jgi:nicotinamidase-related amidase